MNGNNGTRRSGSSPLGAYPGGNNSPIGSRPNSGSPLGSYPSGNDSSSGAFPSGNNSPIGSRPNSGSPLGSYPSGNDSSSGAFPSGNNSPIGSSPLGAYPGGNSNTAETFPSGNRFGADSYRVNDFGSTENYGGAESYPPYDSSLQNSYPPYGSSAQDSYSSYNSNTQNSYPPYGSSSQGSYSSYNSNAQDSYYNGYGGAQDSMNGSASEKNTGSGGESGLPPLGASPRIATILLGSWIGLTAIATIVLLCCGEKWSIIFELFHLMPILTLYNSVSRRNKLRTAFIGIGASTAFIIFTVIKRINSPRAFVWFSTHMDANFMLLLFTLITSLLIIVPRISYNARLRRCTEKVRAKIVKVDVHRSRSSKGHRTKSYNPTFEYTFRGTTYTSSENVYTNSYTPIVGRKANLFIDPHQPTYITDVEQHESGIIVFRFFGILFYCMCIFAFFVQFLNG